MMTLPIKLSSSAANTRWRLIQAGIVLFGRHGRDAVSTRDLAREAKSNLNAIQYHFGGKNELYIEVAREIAQQISNQRRELITGLSIELIDLTPQDAAQLAAELIVQTTRTFLGLPDLALRGSFMLREQLQPSDAFNTVIYPDFMEPTHAMLTALVATATGDQLESPRAITRAHALYGQALAFGAAGETWRRRLGVTENIDPNVQLALDIIRQSTLATLTSYAPEKEKS
jgi:TetR/AcrR family transcriptional regulator, regulator of cefoperazone and chloramphenicol sensitivity